MLNCLCDIVQFLLNTVIVVTSFVPVQHSVFGIAIVRGECTILILQKLLFCVFHCWYCPLVYDDSVIVLCIILKSHGHLFFSQIPNMLICGIFEPNCFVAEKATHNLQFLIINNRYRNQVFVIKQSNHWKTGIYQG